MTAHSCKECLLALIPISMDSFLVNAAGGSSDTSSSSRSIQFSATAPVINSGTPMIGSVGVSCSFGLIPSETFVEAGIFAFPSFTIPLGRYIGESAASGTFSISAFVGSLNNLASSGYNGTYTDGVCPIFGYGTYGCSGSVKPTITMPAFYAIWVSPGRTHSSNGYIGINSDIPRLTIGCAPPTNSSTNGFAAYAITDFSITAKFTPIQNVLPHP